MHLLASEAKQRSARPGPRTCSMRNAQDRRRQTLHLTLHLTGLMCCAPCPCEPMTAQCSTCSCGEVQCCCRCCHIDALTAGVERPAPAKVIPEGTASGGVLSVGCLCCSSMLARISISSLTSCLKSCWYRCGQRCSASMATCWHCAAIASSSLPTLLIICKRTEEGADYMYVCVGQLQAAVAEHKQQSCCRYIRHTLGAGTLQP